jgi:DNA polymerase III subunit beta
VLAASHRFVERRQTMPILANVLLAAHDSRLSITGTDLEVDGFAKCVIHSKPHAPGRKDSLPVQKL